MSSANCADQTTAKTFSNYSLRFSKPRCHFTRLSTFCATSLGSLPERALLLSFRTLQSLSIECAKNTIAAEPSELHGPFYVAILSRFTELSSAGSIIHEDQWKPAPMYYSKFINNLKALLLLRLLEK
jgi:hypothetical protein